DARALANVSPPLLAAPARVTGALLADFDNDGADELFLCCQGEPNRLFGWREGGWRPLDVGAATLPLGTHELAAALDLDGDGCLELLLFSAAADGRASAVFRVPEARERPWIRLLPLGPEGAPARGATVTLVVRGRRRRRIIDCGDGIVQSEPVAHFGLGHDGRAERVEIRWPDSAYLEIAAPAPGRLHRIPHPGRRLSRDAAR
ncbi:MAG TPA: CRTAC1 family protein, partial [Rhodospirillales bacterium]|nr:CRTAC1 family protein [Rhodospirillales bacterium]